MSHELTTDTRILKPFWSEKYGNRHQLQRVNDFPRGIKAPERVRIYWRLDHYVLQWWDPTAKRNLSDRIDGDLVAAIAKARQIEERLEHFPSSSQPRRRVAPQAVVTAYVADLQSRAEAAEIDPKTVSRYTSALLHFQKFVGEPAVAARFSSASQLNRDFALEFGAYLQNLRISPNGHPNSKQRRMADPGYVEDVVRGMLVWAADPERGNLLPEGFRNPFAGRQKRSNRPVRDLFSEPDVNLSMAADFLTRCDAFQLPLFGLLMLYGLRPQNRAGYFTNSLSAAGCWSAAISSWSISSRAAVTNGCRLV